MESKERVLALDVGNRRIGVAVSDGLGLTSQGVTVISRRALATDLQAVCDLAAKYQVAQIVVGLPLNLNGTVGPQAELVQQFVAALQQVCKVEVVWQDERLTTAAAERTLLAGDASRKKRKQVIDMLAAQMILDTYLARVRSQALFKERPDGEN